MKEITIVVKASVDDYFHHMWRQALMRNTFNVSELIKKGEFGTIKLESIEVDGMKLDEDE